MRNITVALDDETYRRAAIAAAECESSIADLLRAYVEQLASPAAERESLNRRERELRGHITEFTASNRLSRDELHER